MIAILSGNLAELLIAPPHHDRDVVRPRNVPLRFTRVIEGLTDEQNQLPDPQVTKELLIHPRDVAVHVADHVAVGIR